MVHFRESINQPMYFRWKGSFEEDPTPIVIVEWTEDAIGRLIDIIDEKGTHYNYDSVISWRVETRKGEQE